MSAKIKIRFGQVEVEYEGSEEFLRKELPALLKGVLELHRDAPAPQPSSPGAPSAAAPPDPGVCDMSTATIAARTNAKDGGDLIMAAAARLTFSGETPFDRKALLREMRSATGYFKQTHVNNLGNYLDVRLKAGDLNQVSGGKYTLPAKKRSEIEAKLADS